MDGFHQSQLLPADNKFHRFDHEEFSYDVAECAYHTFIYSPRTGAAEMALHHLRCEARSSRAWPRMAWREVDESRTGW